MKIVAFSDFHGSSTAVEKAADATAETGAELMLIAGDLAFHDVGSAFSILQRLSNSKVPIFFVPGNMDTPELTTAQNPGKFTCIHGRCERFGSFSFIGLGGAVQGPFQTPFESSEEEIYDILHKAVKACEEAKVVLLSHAPPKNTSVDLTRSGRHVGSSAVRRFIEEMEPILAVCGHIHEARGIDRIGRTLVLNPGPVQNRLYSLIELTDTIDVKLLEFS